MSECTKNCELVFHMTGGEHKTDCPAYKTQTIFKGMTPDRLEVLRRFGGVDVQDLCDYIKELKSELDALGEKQLALLISQSCSLSERIKELESDLHDAIVREREAEKRAQCSETIVLPVEDGFLGEIDLLDKEDWHSHHYVPTSSYGEAIDRIDVLNQRIKELEKKVEHLTRGGEIDWDWMAENVGLPRNDWDWQMLRDAISDLKFERDEAWNRIDELKPKAAQWDEQVRTSEAAKTTLETLVGSLEDQTEPELPHLDPEEMAVFFRPCESCGETFCDCCYGCIRLSKKIEELEALNASLHFRLTSISEVLWKEDQK